jgi:hypothetical protein
MDMLDCVQGEAGFDSLGIKCEQKVKLIRQMTISQEFGDRGMIVAAS